MWMGTNVIQGCDNSTCPDIAMRGVSIVLALNYTITDASSGKFTGTLKTCKNQVPPVTLTDTGATLVGEPKGTQVQIVIPNSTWDAPQQPTVNITGTLASAGGVLKLDDVVTLDGIVQSSNLGTASTPWPPPAPANSMMPAIPVSDLSNDDGNGNPTKGVTGIARGDMGFFVPRVALMTTAPQADKLFLALRTEFKLDGCMSSCTDGSGMASVPLLNNHVIGCHLQGGDEAGTPYCNATQYNFIDQNTTNYMVTSGSFTSKILTGEGGTVSCADVRAMFP
jgi:hypothetical protein